MFEGQVVGVGPPPKRQGWLGLIVRCSDKNGTIAFEPSPADKLRRHCFYCVAIRSEDVERIRSVLKMVVEGVL